MDGLQLRDEAVRDRIRLAEEFLDPSTSAAKKYMLELLLITLDDPRARRSILSFYEDLPRKLTAPQLPCRYHPYAESGPQKTYSTFGRRAIWLQSKNSQTGRSTWMRYESTTER